MSNFVHLRCHTSFSLAEGAIKIDDLINLIKQNNMPALAVTDSGNLFCSLEFSLACIKSGIQPIIGCILQIDMQQSKSIELSQILLIAKNDIGFKNLLHICSQNFLVKYDNLANHIKLSDLQEHSEGIICLTSGHLGAVGQALLKGNEKLAQQYLLQLHEIFGNRLYIEIMRHGLIEQNKIEESLLNLAYQHNIALVATNDVMFSTSKMYEAHHALTCISSGNYVSDDASHKFTPHHYFKSAKEMEILFSDLPEAIENTLVIAKRCSVMAESRNPILPSISKNEGQELIGQARNGLTQRLAGSSVDKQVYFDRLEYELDIIGKMDFPGYFLIVSDFIKWSKRNGIPVGPGRGSGAGSVVAWSLEITDLDPIKFGLLFERFLNPERISLPDFDIDFCQHRRDEVIRYVQSKYGEDKVAQIITFGKLQARVVLRDVGRVLQIPYNQIDRIAKMVPFNAVNPVTLAQAIEMEPLLRKEQTEDPEIAKLIDIALQLEGLHRHASTHAAGIVIADQPLKNIIPLYCDEKSSMLVIQYSMKYAELAGLVKFDFLGLKTLTVIDQTTSLIKKTKADFNISDIALDNPAVFNLLSQGKSTGIFQFESSGMKDALRKMRPDSFADMIALGALYRPGPMDNIPTYIACKHGIQKPDYLHPSLEIVLKDTFGVIIYQEQVMEIAQIMAGYSLGAADLLRKAMGKKIKAEMDDQRQIFISGAIKNGIEESQASYIFDLVAKFAGYGFNKAHATAYALISYQTAYLKANFLLEFLTASLNLEIDDTDKLNIFQQEAKNFAIEILPPDINLSQSLFTIENGSIRYGLGAIKNIGIHLTNNLCQERDSKGLFKDIFDFAERVSAKTLHKRALENLIKAGAFDSLNNNRQQLFMSMDLLSNYNNIVIKEKESKQGSLFGNSFINYNKPIFPKIDDWNKQEKVFFEFEAIGFYLSAHPLDQYKHLLEQTSIFNSDYLKNEHNAAHSIVEIAGMIISNKAKVSPKGRYGQAIISDHYGCIEISFFDSNLLQKIPEILGNNIPVVIKVELRKDEGGIRATGQEIYLLEDYISLKMQRFSIVIEDKTAITELKTIFEQQQTGNVDVFLEVIENNDKEIIIKLPHKLALKYTHYQKMKAIKGIQKIKIDLRKAK
jgi:DNA polymerase III subunit alpha